MQNNQIKIKYGSTAVIFLAIGLIIGYIIGIKYNSISNAYNYIANHPIDYIDFVNDVHLKNKEELEDCIHFTNCSIIESELNADKKAWFAKGKTKEEIDQFLNTKREKLQKFYEERYNTQMPTDYLIDRVVFNSLQNNGSIGKNIQFVEKGLDALLKF